MTDRAAIDTPARADTLTPAQIDGYVTMWLKDLDSPVQAIRQSTVEKLLLCELALDGLRFRIWCQGACAGHGVTLLARLLAKCGSVHEYREAIDKFIVERARGNRDL